MEKVIYCKYSNERSRRFSVRTEILEEDGVRRVRKTPLYPEGKRHIQRLPEIARALNEEYASIGLLCSESRREDEGITLPYIDGITMEDYLDDLIAEERTEEAEKLFTDYLDRISSYVSAAPFAAGEEFREIFGEVSLPEGLRTAKTTNIDMVCQNILMTEPQTVIDYEWSVDFPVPGAFILYRIIHYFCAAGVGRSAFDEKGLCEKYGLKEELISVFEKMEESFQSFLTRGHVPVRDLYDFISPGIGAVKVEEPLRGQIYFRKEGEELSEESSVRLPVNNGVIFQSAAIPEGKRLVRLDPCDVPCAVRLGEILFDDAPFTDQEGLTTNGRKEGEWYLFTEADPWFSGIIVPEGCQKITVRLEVIPLPQELHPVFSAFTSALYAEREKNTSLLGELNDTRHQRNLTSAELQALKTEHENILTEHDRLCREHIALTQSNAEMKAEYEARIQTQESSFAQLRAQYEVVRNEAALLREQNQGYRNLIRDMKATKVWKAYEKYKQTIGRK